MYDEAYFRRLEAIKERKRQKSDKTAEVMGVRYCASGTHYVELAQITKRRHGKSGPWICDGCHQRRMDHMKSRQA